MRGWIAVVVVAVLAGPGWAQPRRAPLAGAPAAGAVERREQIKKRIRAMRAYTLTEELRLDEPTAGRLFPLLARYDDEVDRLLEKRVELQRRLRHADTARDPRATDRLIDEAIANQRALWDLEDRKLADLRKLLTPAQTAKLLVVLPALERKIENQLRRAIAQRRGAAAAPSGPAEAEDDDPEPDETRPQRPRLRREGTLAPRNNASSAPGNTPPCDPAAGPCR